MRQFAPLLLGLLLLTGCPQGGKSVVPTEAKSAPAKSVAKSVEVEALAKSAEVKPEAKTNEIAKLPQLTYYAFKG